MRLAICGSFGFGNAGDEAVPLAFSDLAASESLQLEIQPVTRYDNPAMSGIIGRTKAVTEGRFDGETLLFAGGGIVESTPNCVLLRCGDVVRQGGVTKAALLGASAEPGVGYPWLISRRLRRALRSIDTLFMRDHLSASVLRSIVPKRKVEVVGDSVLWMNPAPTLPEPLQGAGRYIAVSLASTWRNAPNFVPWLAEHLARLAVRLDAVVAFVPCASEYDHDCEQHRAVAELVQAINPDIKTIELGTGLDARDVMAALGGASLVIGMRLHACVMAYARQVPFIGLAYHPKLIGFAETVGWREFVLPQMVTSKRWSGAYGYAFDETGLAACDLESKACAALDHASFDQLPNLKATFRQALWSIVGSAAIRETQVPSHGITMDSGMAPRGGRG